MASSRKAESSARVGLSVKVVGLLLGSMALLSLAFSLWTVHSQRLRTESEMLEESRVLVQEMDAVWDFVSINQNVINYTRSGDYEYKGLHCAIAGKSVAALFSQRSDYKIEFTNLNPRNMVNRPDAVEVEALEFFADNPGETEYYRFAQDEDGSQVFRYISAMRVDESCIECHGKPAGELDPTGYPKEGWALGDLAGAECVTVPTDLYFDNMRQQVLSNIGFFLLVLMTMAGIVLFALNRLVAHPLRNLADGLNRMGHSSADEVVVELPDNPYGSNEVDSIIVRFNEMSMRLGELYGSLESQVALRTAELSAANEELERQREHVEEMNEKLVVDNRYKTDFLAIVSHELRTPLTSILAFAELMHESIPADDSEALRQLDEVEKNGAILLEMVNNVLETARIQAGSEKLNLELVDLADLVGMVAENNEALAYRQGVELTTSVGRDVPLVMSDWEKLRRILVNLVSNAIKFTPAGGSVTVTVRMADAGWIAIDVADTGIGIAPENHALVFERFTQENMSTSRRYGGSGLGLSLVRDLATMLGGSVELESQLGEGSTFTVYLPADWDPEDTHEGNAD